MRDLERKSLTIGDIFIRFVILAFAAVILMALQITGRLTPIQSTITQITSSPQLVVTSMSDSVAGWLSSVRSVRTLSSENNQLTAQNAELRAQIVELEEQLVEYTWMREQLNFADVNPGVSLSGAQIVARRIGEESSNFRDFLLLDLGTEHGVAVGMPVITNAGLVGRISEVNRSTSKVLLITDPNSQVNAILSEARISGIIQGNPGGTISLNFVQEGPPIAIGETILTSGSSISTGSDANTSRRFPKGIPIGAVTEVIDSDELISRRAIVEPLVAFERLELVLIVTNFDSLVDDIQFPGVDPISSDEQDSVEQVPVEQPINDENAIDDAASEVEVEGE